MVAGRRILGSTLWFPDRPDNHGYENMLNDFRKIRGFKELVYAAHTKACQFFEDELRGSSFSEVEALLAAAEQAHPNLPVLNFKSLDALVVTGNLCGTQAVALSFETEARFRTRIGVFQERRF
jgi:hypothetical protein